MFAYFICSNRHSYCKYNTTEHIGKEGMPVTFLDHKCINIESKRSIDSTVRLNNQATDDESCAISVHVHEDTSINCDLEAQTQNEYEREYQLKNEDSSGNEIISAK